MNVKFYLLKYIKFSEPLIIKVVNFWTAFIAFIRTSYE